MGIQICEDKLRQVRHSNILSQPFKVTDGVKQFITGLTMFSCVIRVTVLARKEIGRYCRSQYYKYNLSSLTGVNLQTYSASPTKYCAGLKLR